MAEPTMLEWTTDGNHMKVRYNMFTGESIKSCSCGRSH